MNLRISGKLILFAAVAALLLTASCSRRSHPASSRAGATGRTNEAVVLETPAVTLRLTGVTMSGAEKKRLEEFMEDGIGRSIDIPAVSPEAIIETARTYLGVPHCMGGTTSKCMDCSGLIFRVFDSHGIILPHNSEEQARYGTVISDRGNLRPGDLLFFIRTYNTSRLITHSGIYTGNGSFIHTSSSKGVTVTSLDDPWWSERYLFATRILR